MISSFVSRFVSNTANHNATYWYRWLFFTGLDINNGPHIYSLTFTTKISSRIYLI